MTRLRGKNQTHLRRENIGNVLRLICLHGSLSRTELTSMLGLSKMGVSKIVTELIGDGFLLESKDASSQNSQGGPIPLALSIAPERLMSIGISITLESIECALADLSKGILYSIRRDIFGVKDDSVILDLISELMTDISLRAMPTDSKILGIGVSIAGLVNKAQNYVDDRPNHLGKIQENLHEFLAENYHLPVFIMNNMNASVLAEYYFGSDKGTQTFIYVGVGDGVGGGFLQNGQLIDGNQGFATEIGHMTIANNGKACRCGNFDCAELYVSSNALIENTKSASWGDFQNKLSHQDVDFIQLDNYRRDLTTMLINTIHAYDPCIVILGEHIATLDDCFFEKLNHDVNQRIAWRNQGSIPIKKSRFGKDASIVGSYSQIFHAAFNGQIDIKYNDI